MRLSPRRSGGYFDAGEVLVGDLTRLLDVEHRLQSGDGDGELRASGSRVVSFWSCSPGHMIQRTQRLRRLRPAHLMISNAMPATSGTPSTRERNSMYQAGAPERREDEHGDDHHDQQEARPAARVQARVALGALRDQLVAGLVAGDHLVLGAVVLEHAAQVLHAREQHQVAEEDRDADQLLDDDEDDELGSASLNRVVSPTGSRKNRPTANSSATTIVPAHVPPEIGSSSSGSCALAEMPSALKPMAQRLAERDDAADDRQAQRAGGA